MPLPLKHLLASCMFALGLGMAAPAVAQGQTPGQPQMPSQNRSGQPVDLDLVLLADSTGSIDDREIFFQRQGYADAITDPRSEEHTSELQSLMRISYAVFCLKKKKTQK